MFKRCICLDSNTSVFFLHLLLLKFLRVVIVVFLQDFVFFYQTNMVDYEVTVFTADAALATTFNNVFIKLVGTDGESERQWLMSLKGPAAFLRATVCPSSLSPLAVMIC